ncbi:MAG TPA: retroviral-like aspartic protease family protein, partial [Caulobacteraceae bacterium]
MRTGIVTSLLVTWIVGAEPAAAAEAQPHCQLQAVGELPLVGGQMVTEASVDGRPVKLLIDTGAFGTLLFTGEARRLGLFLRPTGAKSYGVGGESDVFSARVKEFKLGDMVERDADLVVAGETFKGIQGVLGAKFLMQADVEFDLAHGKVRFFKPKGCAGDEVVYWGAAYSVAPMVGTPRDQILVRVSVNGAPIVAQMDTGASASVLTPGAAARAGVTVRSAGVVAAGALRGLGRAPVESRVGTFSSFSFGEETIKNTRLQIADMFGADKDTHINTRIASAVTDQPQ